jgi:hypothetical protein
MPKGRAKGRWSPCLGLEVPLCAKHHVVFTVNTKAKASLLVDLIVLESKPVFSRGLPRQRHRSATHQLPVSSNPRMKQTGFYSVPVGICPASTVYVKRLYQLSKWKRAEHAHLQSNQPKGVR